MDADSLKRNITINEITVDTIAVPNARNIKVVVDGTSDKLSWSYARLPSNCPNMDILGYDIYRDGVKLNDEPVTSLEYTDSSVETGKYVYSVVALNNIELANATGISIEAEVTDASDVKPSGDKVIVITTTKCGMVRVSGASGASLTVSSAQGIVVADKVATEVEEINVNSGIYLIQVDTDVVKVRSEERRVGKAC